MTDIEDFLKDVNYYLYDNYYNVQSAGLFSQIVATWFESPALVSEIYQKAGIALPNISQNKLAKTFKTLRTEPATINVSISGANRDDLEKLINAAGTVLQEKSDDLNQNSENIYEIAKFTPIITNDNPNLTLNTIIGLVGGLFLALIIIFGAEYFKQEK